MITYKKTPYGFGLFLRAYGSAFPKALPFSLFSTLLSALLQGMWGKELAENFKHPYPYQAFAFMVGFMIVFRTNFGYARYWEGRTQLQAMTAKITDVVVDALAFDKLGSEKWTMEEQKSGERFRDTFVHIASLLHAVALLTLRDDYDLGNIHVHDSLSEVLPDNAAPLMRSRSDMTQQMYQSSGSDSAKPRPHFQQHALRMHLIDVFVLRTNEKFRRELYAAMPISVVGGLTSEEAAALGSEAYGGDWVMNDNLAMHGVFQDDGSYTPAPVERAHAVSAWARSMIIDRMREGGIAVPAPLITRLFAVLSDAMLGYEQCRKLVDTPFPFPWAQAVAILLFMFTCTVPIIIAAHTTTIYMATIITFCSVHAYHMLNEVARDLEDPFEYDPNELALPQLQFRLNERLLSVSRNVRPRAFTDLQALQGPGNLPDTTTNSAMLEVNGDPPLVAYSEVQAARLNSGTSTVPRAGEMWRTATFNQKSNSMSRSSSIFPPQRMATSTSMTHSVPVNRYPSNYSLASTTEPFRPGADRHDKADSDVVGELAQQGSLLKDGKPLTPADELDPKDRSSIVHCGSLDRFLTDSTITANVHAGDCTRRNPTPFLDESIQSQPWIDR